MSELNYLSELMPSAVLFPKLRELKAWKNGQVFSTSQARSLLRDPLVCTPEPFADECLSRLIIWMKAQTEAHRQEELLSIHLFGHHRVHAPSTCPNHSRKWQFLDGRRFLTAFSKH